MWQRWYWWCAQGAEHGCGFAARAETQPGEPTLIPTKEIEKGLADATAATLTANAYGPMGAFSFVHESDYGRGLFARQGLKAGDDIGEYGGPRYSF